jgi:hypothetical protein
MKLKIALFILLAALPLLEAAQVSGRVSGRVLSGDGTTQIADAIVTVTSPWGYVSSVVTNGAGEFSLTSLPVGEYDLRVTAHGYAIYQRQVTVSGNIGLRELAIRLFVPVDKQTISVGDLRNPS